MLFKPLAFAATAAAILIVPETSNNEDGIFRALPIEASTFELPAIAHKQAIDVPCLQCRGKDTHLELDFGIKNRRLVLNGFELYPRADPWNGDLSAAVIKGNGKSDMRRLGYGLAIRPEGIDEDQHLEIVNVEVRIIEVGDRFVDGVPPVTVKLIKSLSGDILIGNIEIKGTGEKAPEDCDMWCRTKDMVHDTWKGVKGKFKGCHGMKPHHGHEHHKPHHGAGKAEHKPTDNFKQGPLMHKKPEQSMGEVLKHVAAYIVLPVLMGVAAGVGVAFFVMCLFSMVHRLVCLFRGESSESTESLAAYHQVPFTELDVEDEKTVLNKTLPQYESRN
ncbi:hypothetical protein FVEN_g2655 [Fusarium venenatum]|uniref:DUF7728 domain-containing protein n=1 Tax=Fusarium venenatum TaxID=56646 RepID=A0A2L2SVS9_9HYPO|nr:uncharacterized protein FVRRES_05114 [Fusarium venenatum]KAG8359803.1 hypothetical protein FVEN_g2655 [Fusarium venenatum]KAH6992236.1 hypothetical protein EDB82DRAFT_495710 [Fusarium venenatum]CEI60678.1 unnamed protein product [Fusarium venenatum]